MVHGTSNARYMQPKAPRGTKQPGASPRARYAASNTCFVIAMGLFVLPLFRLSERVQEQERKKDEPSGVGKQVD